MEQLLINLISGVAGGNAAGAVMKNKSLGLIGNSLAGIIGGGLGGQLLSLLNLGGEGIGTEVAGGGVGGALLMVIVSFVKNAITKN
jgi:uncharacterized membrane protein YeaQ/YmgE (transglycosylase-associated protein family)